MKKMIVAALAVGVMMGGLAWAGPFKCKDCNGTGWYHGGNQKCMACKGTGSTEY